MLGSARGRWCNPIGLLTRDTAGQETVLYSFQGTYAGYAGDGANPEAGLVLDAQGNLYGTTYLGGDLNCAEILGQGCGTVFKVDTSGKETVLYSFKGFNGEDGSLPAAGLVRDAQGNLYGTTAVGGVGACSISGYGCGTVFKVDTSGNETVLYSFTTTGGGAVPDTGLVRDAPGNLYGTTFYGGGLACNGGQGCGTVFKLRPSVGSCANPNIPACQGK